MKKTITICIIAILAISTMSFAFQMPTTSAASQTSINESIARGLAYLASTQATDGHWGSSSYVACTAMAVLAFENAGYHAGDSSVYAMNVQKGLNYLFTRAAVQSISIQSAGNPDTNGNGIGIYFDYGGQPVYQTPMALMAIIASQSPTTTATAGPANVIGRTYYDIAKDAVDYLAWAQTESSGTARGGWRYSPNYGSSDNSVSQWPTLGLMAAEFWGINAPAFVKSELLRWTTASQQLSGTPASNYYYGAFGYDSPTYLNSIVESAAGILELSYCGVAKTDSRIVAAQGYINRDWTTSSSWRVNLGNFYAMYGVMKACRQTIPTPVKYIANYDSSPGVEWYNGTNQYADLIISHQTASGYWNDWVVSTGMPTALTTAFAELILEYIPVVVTYDLTITVTDPGIPIAGAEVIVEGPETRTGYTDSNGQVTFEDLQAGSYTVSITKPGFISPEVQTIFLSGTTTLTYDLEPVMATSADVWTTDSTGTVRTEFGLGEEVYIHWTPTPSDAHIDIKVTEQATSDIVFGPLLNQPADSSPLHFTPPAPGYYDIVVNGEPVLAINTISFFVLPESLLGTLLSVIASFSAVFVFYTMRRGKLATKS